MRLSWIALFVVFVSVGISCRTKGELRIETGKGQYGVIRVNGSEKEWIIGPGYERIWIVPGGEYFWAKDRGKWGVLTEKGRVLEFEYDSLIESDAPGIYFARKFNHYAVVSLDKSCVSTDAVYDSAWSVITSKERFEVYTFVRRNGKYGVVSPQCKELLPPIYDTVIWEGADAWPDPILYSFNGKCGIINSKGEQVAPLGYDSISVCICSELGDACFAYLNDSLAFFTREGKPYKKKIHGDGISELEHWAGLDANIGCKVRHDHYH